MAFDPSSLDPSAMLAAFKQRLSAGNPNAAASASPEAQALGPAGVAAQATDPLTDQPLTPAAYASGSGGIGQDGGKILTTLPERSGKKGKSGGSTGSGAGLDDMLAAFSKSSEASPDPWQAFSNGLSSGLSGISESRSASAKSKQDSIDKRFNQLQKILEYDRNLKKDEEAARHNRASEANDATSKKAYRDSVDKQGKGKGKDGPTEIQIRKALRDERKALAEKYGVDDVTLTPEQKAAKQAQIDTEMKGIEQSIRGGKQEDAEGGAEGAPMAPQPGQTLPRRNGDVTAPNQMQPSGPVTPVDQTTDDLSGASFTPDAQQSAAARPPRDQVISDARNALARGAQRDQVFAGMRQFGVDPSELDPPSNNQPSAPAQEQQGGGFPWARMLEALTNAGAGF